MAALIQRWWLTGLAGMVLVACVSPPPPPDDVVASRPRGPGSGPAVETRPTRASPPTPLPVQTYHGPGSWLRPPALNLQHWPWGWIQDGDPRLGPPVRFFTEQRLLWLEVLDPRTAPAGAARRLETILKASKNPTEGFHASWRLWNLYHQASLDEEARDRLDQAWSLVPVPVVALERAWDQAFREADSAGARVLWTSPRGPWLTAEDERKAALLRQKLFLGSQSLTSWGADDYVSSLSIDRDDLWISTWNGAVLRWSMATELYDLLRSPGAAVSPVKNLVATGWFVYLVGEAGMERYSKVTGNWRSIPYPPDWTGLRVQGVVADGEESLWVAYLGQGLWRWTAGEWQQVDDGGTGPFLNALASDGEGGLWVGTKDRGLWHWKDGGWTPIAARSDRGPTNISVIQGSPDGRSWAVGTWGEGAWVLQDHQLTAVSDGREYVTAAAWDGDVPLWGLLDQGVVLGMGEQTVGPSDGLGAGGVSALVCWQGRWIWGTMGQGLGWWSEYEDH